MSLLLDALKKAEQAKQAAQTEPSGATPGATPDIDLTGEMGETVVTRKSLPDISPSLEITSPEAERGPGASAGSPAAPSTSPELAAPNWDLADAQPETGASEDLFGNAPGGDSGRRAAQQVFQAKEVNYNPRRPFYITVGLLIACGAGYAGYVWWQLQPHYVYNAAAVQAVPKSTSAAETPPPAAAAATNAAVSGPLAAASTTGASPAAASVPPAAGAAPFTAQGLISTPAAAPQSQPAARGGPAPSPRDARASGRAAAQPASGQTASAEAALPRTFRPTPARGDIGLSVSPSTQTVDPLLQQGYESFQRGDISQARAIYQRVLQRDSGNHDALLGLAAIDMKNGDFGTAQSRYQRLLELNPHDPYAQAGMAVLNGQVDSVQSESRLKTLIAEQPEVPDLHFALGNQFSAQKRWAEAQAAYFKAFTLDSANPDYAFNLAVSLDQLHQTRAALEYYRQAVALAASRSAAFDPAQAARRVKELTR